MQNCSNDSKLFIDIGNTNIKYQIDNGIIQSINLNEFKINNLPKIEQTYVSSVLDDTFNNKFPASFIFVRTQKKYKNLINAYSITKDLGVDRWLNLIATYEKYPKKDCLIIDIGSAITIDVLKADGKHLGGWIMPGLTWLKNTKEIFNQQEVKESNTPNIETKTAWHNGCRLMIIDMIKARILEYSSYKVVITGGGAKYLGFNNKENLVLQGLKFWHKNSR
ncbi:Pantothenate kinase type III, CoaX-like [hydrothermal vent metagenome]|uniref:Type III pantothenate kinase n=1 Tax=hydrothermal vent metagenome TaxID=652676 RepID=A0A1W1CJU7_9ZZZZ